MSEDKKDIFVKRIGEENVLTDESMSRHTTFRIGGGADYFLIPHSLEEVRELVTLCEENAWPYFILGNGSNLLVGDHGYRGVVIQLFKNWNQVEVEGTTVRAQSGALLSVIASQAAGASLTGFEFAGGIPGTLGGAVVMNAGAYGGEMKDVLSEVTVLTKTGEVRTLSGEELALGYRTSRVKEEGYLVLEAVIQLSPGKPEEIREIMWDLARQRTSKQPLDCPSAGSTFKRPEGHFAGKLIMDAGLRGHQVGGAQVSEKHCGFVINTGSATARDVRQLMQEVQDRVREQFGVSLEPEVKFLGEF